MKHGIKFSNGSYLSPNRKFYNSTTMVKVIMFLNLNKKVTS